MPRRLVIAVFVLFGSVTVWADDRPLLLPTRDVDVTYQMNRPGRAAGTERLEQRLRWAAASQQLRVDPPFAGLYILVDYPSHTLRTVRVPEKLVLRMESGEAKLPLLPVGPSGTKLSGATFSRTGTDQVAGLPCTDWLTRDTAGDAATLCLTSDGVLLRARIGDAVVMQAASVTYGPIPPDVFQLPAGYQQIAVPKGLGGIASGLGAAP